MFPRLQFIPLLLVIGLQTACSDSGESNNDLSRSPDLPPGFADADLDWDEGNWDEEDWQ